MNHTAILNDDELIQLDEQLIEYGHDDSLGIDEAHGYFSALAVANSSLSDAEIIEAVLGQATGDDKADLVSLLLRMNQNVISELVSDEPFEPMVIEEEDDDGQSYELYEGWCFGFMLAVTDNEAAWAELSKEAKNLIEPIATLALMREEELDMDDEEYAGWVSLLPGAVNELYRSFR